MDPQPRPFLEAITSYSITVSMCMLCMLVPFCQHDDDGYHRGSQVASQVSANVDRHGSQVVNHVNANLDWVAHVAGASLGALVATHEITMATHAPAWNVVEKRASTLSNVTTALNCVTIGMCLWHGSRALCDFFCIHVLHIYANWIFMEVLAFQHRGDHLLATIVLAANTSLLLPCHTAHMQWTTRCVVKAVVSLSASWCALTLAFYTQLFQL